LQSSGVITCHVQNQKNFSDSLTTQACPTVRGRPGGVLHTTHMPLVFSAHQ